MDRLFLAGLVRELAASLIGSRVRAVELDPRGRIVSVALSRPRRHEIVFHLGPGMAGLLMRETALRSDRPSTREKQLSKLLASAAIVSLDMTELDRIVTLVLERTRLSGKKRRFAVVLELIPTRSAAYLVDLPSHNIVDKWSVGAARAGAGDRYHPPAPPPHAAPPAASAEAFVERLWDAGGGLDKASLLSATGWTPLLVRELQAMVRDGGETPSAAFGILSDRLRDGRPVVYAKRPKVLLSPVTLASEKELGPVPMPTFNAAMTEALRLTSSWEREDALSRKLGAAVDRRLKNLRALTDKLVDQQARLPDPRELRKRGETLLAGIGRAQRSGDARVVVPDPFHAESRTVEIPIDPRLGLPENAQSMFRRSRKVERTEVELGRRLQGLTQQIDYLEGVRVSLDDASGLEELESLRREAEEQGLVPREAGRARVERRQERLGPRSYRSRLGNPILVGRSARSNEDVTFRLAKPNDLWFHASGVPGSHVVLKLSGSARADDEEIRDAAGYAAHFSKARRDAHVDVTFTERRNVSKIKGAPPGLVKVARARTVRVRPTPPDVGDGADDGTE